MCPPPLPISFSLSIPSAGIGNLRAFPFSATSYPSYPFFRRPSHTFVMARCNGPRVTPSTFLAAWFRPQSLPPSYPRKTPVRACRSCAGVAPGRFLCGDLLLRRSGVSFPFFVCPGMDAAPLLGPGMAGQERGRGGGGDVSSQSVKAAWFVEGGGVSRLGKVGKDLSHPDSSSTPGAFYT